MIKLFFTGMIFIITFLLFESSILTNLIFLPAVPDLLLIVTLYLSLHNGPLPGQLYGFTGGLLLDFISAGPLGLNALVRTVIGYCCGLLTKTLNTRGILLPAFLGFCVTLFKSAVILLVSFFFPSGIKIYPIFSTVTGFEFLFNTMLTPLIFWFLNLFADKIILKPENNV